MEEFKTMEMIEKIREEHYQLLKGKTAEEKITIYHEAARRVHERAKGQTRVRG
jgi:hypothetical protein